MRMSVSALHETYRVRPDIFMKVNQERLYVRYLDRHYIVRLNEELRRSVTAFLDRLDGWHPLANVISLFPQSHRPSLLKFLDFLLQKGAAFRLPDGPLPAELAPVAHTLTYLSEYVAHPVDSYRRFSSSRILLVGGGYALTSAIRTLSRFGVQQLSVMNIPELGCCAFTEDELATCFDEVKTSPDARLTSVPPESISLESMRSFDHVLHCQERMSVTLWEEFSALPAAAQLYGVIAGQTLCITNHIDDVRRLARIRGADPDGTTTVAPSLGLIGGAIVALTLFDHLTGVRPLTAGHYHYCDLEAQGALRSAPRYHLRGIPEAASSPVTIEGSADLPHASDEWEELAAAPLFPLRDLVEATDQRSYIKVYTASFRATDGSDSQRGTVAGAGFTKQLCLRQLLLTLIGKHGLALSRGVAAEDNVCIDTAARLRRANKISANLRPRLADASAMEAAAVQLGAKEEYIVFCIGTSFDVLVSWADLATADEEFSRCLVARAGSTEVFMPYADAPSTDDRQALLFGLYAALWSRNADKRYSVAETYLPGAALAFAGSSET